MFTTSVIVVVILVLLFDYINGFHDTANAIATSVSTKALTPRQAVIVAAVFNLVGAWVGKKAVAATIGMGIVTPQLVTGEIISAALAAAIFWNLFTWYFGIPSSSTHALIGGLTGAVIASAGTGAVNWQGFAKILTGLIGSPIIGLVIGSVVMTVLFWVFRNSAPNKINNNFRNLQVLSACALSFSHGSNDAQKAMGIITMVLLSNGLISTFQVPDWVKISCAMAMALGTAMGGWKIIRTMGGKIFRIEPINGFASDCTSSLVIFGGSLLGIPVSTTHVVSSSIMGVGAAKRLKGVRWNIAGQILTAWVVTIPSSALVAMIFYKIIRIFL